MFFMPRFHPGCWAWEGWDPVLRIWDNPVPAISETANFISDPVAGSAWIPLDRILPSLSGAEMGSEGTGKCQFWAGLWGFSWITAETALAALRWWRAGCATGWPRAGQSSASQMQFVVGGFSHPRKNRLLLVRPGCPPCFSSGHSLAACCWQPKPAFNSPALPKCTFYNYILLPSSVGSAIPQPPGLWNALLGADKERGWSNALLIFN